VCALAAAVALAVAVAGCGNTLSRDDQIRLAGGVAAPAAPAPAVASQGLAPAADAGGVVGTSVPGPSAATGAAGATQAGAQGGATSGSANSADDGAGVRPSAAKGSDAATAASAVCTGSKAPIVLGAVGQLSGVLGAAFIGGTRAIQAWISSVNASGGLGCHPVRYVTADDGGDPSRHLSLVRKLVEQDKVIAMLYQTALLTGQASRDYLLSKKIPLIGQEGGELHTFDSPLFFNHGTSGKALFDFTLVAGARIAKAAGQTKVGTLVCQEVSACKTNEQSWSTLGPKFGLDVVYRGQASLLTVDFTSQCLAAKNAGVQVLGVSFESTGIHRIAQSCASVGYKPVVVCTSVQSNLDFRDDENLEGVVIAQPYRPWFLTDTPGMQTYQRILKQFAPDLVLDSASINGWTAAQLFSRATAAFKEDVVTSDGIVQALAAVKNDDLGGLTYPLSFSTDKAQEPKACGWIVRVQNGNFTSDGKRFCG
jgi:ABC-type branched-subunit amino acid transport system substrate-binding protein